MKTRHQRTLRDEAFAHYAFSDPLHAVAAAVSALTGHALAGARVESFTLKRHPRVGDWNVVAEITPPATEGDWTEVDDITRSAASYAPYVLFREPPGGAVHLHDAVGEWHALGDYPSPAEGFRAEHARRVRGHTLALIAAEPLQYLLPNLNELDFLKSSETFARKDGEDGWAFEVFQQLDAMTQSAGPRKTPAENLLAGMDRLDRAKLREAPSRMDFPAEGEYADEIEAAKGVLRSVSLMGAQLPTRRDPQTWARHPSLSELQRRRERARGRYDALLAGPGLSDADRDFLLMSPPGEDAWWDVLLGSTSGTGQKAMRVIYAGLLAFWEAATITRAMDWAGDSMRQEKWDAPLPITECYSAWTGFRSGRVAPCPSSN